LRIESLSSEHLSLRPKTGSDPALHPLAHFLVDALYQLANDWDPFTVRPNGRARAVPRWVTI
jgi:hypothetical protein